MARFFTKTQALSASLAHRYSQAKSSRQILAEDSAKSPRATNFDIFLSHSSADAELILGVKVILEGRGFSVYVDWDTDMQLDRTKVSKATAAILRLRMQNSKSLIYVATENASNSKWMPWELGYFDGLHKGGVAILPILADENSTFSGQEYLGLYPIVTKDFYQNSQVEDVFVEEAGTGWTTLNQFAKGNFSLVR